MTNPGHYDLVDAGCRMPRDEDHVRRVTRPGRPASRAQYDITDAGRRMPTDEDHLHRVTRPGGGARASDGRVFAARTPA